MEKNGQKVNLFLYKDVILINRIFL